MNIYEKLQQARLILQNTELKKSGLNKFAGFNYYELKDFIPEVNKIFLDMKLFSKVTFDNDFAKLEIINIEKPEETILFTSPFVMANVKGAQDIQNLGATQTYQRRYLYLVALEITENDVIDSLDQKEQKKQEVNYYDEVLKIVKSKSLSSDYMTKTIADNFGNDKKLKDLKPFELKKLYEAIK